MTKRPPLLAYLVTLGLCTTVPFMALLGYNIYAQYESDRAGAISHLDTLRLAAAQQIGTYLRDVELILAELASDPAVQAGEPGPMVAALKQRQASRPDLANLAALDQEGHILATILYAPADPTTTLRPLAGYREGLEATGFHISQPFQGTITKKWTCVASYPVLDAAGRRIATIIAPLNLTELSRRFFFETPNADSIISVIDTSGVLLMRSFDPEKWIGTSSEQIQSAIALSRIGLKTGEITGRDGRERIYSMDWVNGTTWSIGASLPREKIFAFADDNRRRSLLLLTGFVVLIGFAVGWLARNLNRPIRSLALAARAQATGLGQMVEANISGPAEIADTARALNEMLASRRHAEQSLRTSEQRYRTVVDQTGQMIYEVDLATGGIVWFGAQAIEQTTGYSLADFPVSTLTACEEFTHPDDRAAASARFEQCLATGEFFHMEYRFRQKDGSYRHVEDHGVFVLDSTGRPCRMLGRMSDITQRKRAAETLRQVIDLVPHFIFAKDRDGRYVLANMAVARAFGTTPQGLVGTTDGDWTKNQSQAPAYQSADRAVLQAGQPVVIPEESFVDATGAQRLLSTVKIPFHLAGMDQRCVLGVSVDITALKNAAEARQQIEKKLLETQKLESLGVLAGGIAHDFNNLLTGILGNASLARLDAPPGWRGLDSLAAIELASRRAADLCTQMLAYSGKGRFIVQRVDLNELLRDTTQLLTLSISKKAVLRYNLASALPSIQADATQIRQVAMNLVINASEALGERNGTITLSTGRLALDADDLVQEQLANELTPGDYVYLEVSDDGAGMTPETLARIFDPFFTTKFTGRGLGLAAVHGIVRGHSGALKVASEPHRGTAFRLFFPVVAGDAEAVVAAAATVPGWQGSGRLLVVDDEEAIRAVSVRIAERLGFTVDTAVDGLEGLKLFRAKPDAYVAVLLDLTMPGLDGEETFRQLRLLRPEVSVVLMSGFNKAEAINRFLGQGLAGFVQKPFALETLAAELRRVLEGSRSPV